MSIKEDNIIAGFVAPVFGGGIFFFLIWVFLIPKDYTIEYWTIISIPWSTFAAWCIYSGFNQGIVTIHKDTDDDDDRKTFDLALGIPPALVFFFFVLPINIDKYRNPDKYGN